MDKVKQLTELKNHIESLEKHHQIEILKILSKNMCKINENKSGVFVNMTFLEDTIIEEIKDYLLRHLRHLPVILILKLLIMESI